MWISNISDQVYISLETSSVVFCKISERIILKLLILSNETLIGHTLFQYQGGFLIQTLDIRKNPERFLRFVKFKLIFLFKNCLNSVWDSDAKYTNRYLTQQIKRNGVQSFRQCCHYSSYSTWKAKLQLNTIQITKAIYQVFISLNLNICLENVGRNLFSSFFESKH